jgi:signal transduction histidine kinase
MAKRTWTRWITGPVFGIDDMGWGDIAFAVVLSVFGILIVTHGKSNGHTYDAGWEGALAVLLMTVPVAFARRSPLVVATVMLGGTLVNWAFVDTYVRCGAALPACFYVAYVVGSRCQGRDRWLGFGLLVLNILAQCESDPQIYPVTTAILFVPLLGAFMGAGFLLHRRHVAVAELRARTEELRQQREINANLAVESDRARIAGDVDQYLHDQVQEIASAAAAGQQSLEQAAGTAGSAGSDQAADAFVAIQGTGRDTLAHMRDMVGQLRDGDEAPTGPQPVLAQLDRLVSQSEHLDVRLRVQGDPRLLPPGLELSGFRIVEHLLLTLEQDQSAEASVDVIFGTDSLELNVVGPTVRESAARSALAAATERAQLHGGTLRTTTHDGQRQTLVVLPLAGAQV